MSLLWWRPSGSDLRGFLYTSRTQLTAGHAAFSLPLKMLGVAGPQERTTDGRNDGWHTATQPPQTQVHFGA